MENTVPLINVVFLILIFFLVAGVVAPPTARELIPAETSDLPVVPPQSDVVQILPDGTVLFRGVTTDLDGLLAGPGPWNKTGAGGTALQGSPLRVLVDQRLEAARLIDILERFRAAGTADIRLMTVKGQG
ncbi:ExbD/TolR family protein [Sneathiella chinensis]|nr:biopolymer transporter ExbD [Sneathiella chinensis]